MMKNLLILFFIIVAVLFFVVLATTNGKGNNNPLTTISEEASASVEENLQKNPISIRETGIGENSEKRLDSLPKGELVISFIDERENPVKGIESTLILPDSVLGFTDSEPNRTSDSKGTARWQLVACSGYRWRTSNRDVFVEPIHEERENHHISGEFAIHEEERTSITAVVLSEFNYIAGILPVSFGSNEKPARVRILKRGEKGDKQVGLSLAKANGEFCLKLPRRITGSTYICACWKSQHDGNLCDFVVGCECNIQPGYNNVGVLEINNSSPLEIDVNFVDTKNITVPAEEIFNNPSAVDVEIYLSYRGDSSKDFVTYLHGIAGQPFVIHGLYGGDWLVSSPDIEGESDNFELVKELSGNKFQIPRENKISLTQEVWRNSNCVYVDFKTRPRILEPRVYLKREGNTRYMIHEPVRGFKKLPIGVYDVLLVSKFGGNSFAMETVEIDRQTSVVTLDAKNGCSITGQTDPGGRVTVTFPPWNSNRERIATPSSTTANPEGRFKITGLPPYTEIIVNHSPILTGGFDTTMDIGRL